MTGAPEQVEQNPATPFRVVAACDFSPLGDRALVEAMRVCGAHVSAALHVITVAAESPTGVILPGADLSIVSMDEARKAAQEHTARLVDEYVGAGGSLPLETVAVYVALGTPSERILSLATTIDADLIVLGTHGRHGLERLLLGSVAEAVVRRAPCGVYVIRPRDFVSGEKVPEIQPPLQDGEHPLRPFRTQPVFHNVHRLSRDPGRLMPAI
jgi:nucleotide-binding universal stress UspA family protein